MADVRTRFAPSPTGYLHIGGARTALFNYLLARKHGGRFVLRIEDTDRERSQQTYVDAILDSLAWLGLDYDEGPFFQSQRQPLYDAAIARMLEAGRCYYCFCSAQELDAKRDAAQRAGRKPVYDRTCRDLGRRPKAGEAAVVRMRSPLDGDTAVRDLVRGVVLFDNRELDDFVLVRSDGSPTFYLVGVVDDVEMRISHVLRGEDHLTNTPKQIQIFRALGAEPPAYGHLPLIVGADRARLSKRHGATSVGAYRELGFLPEATLNYLARLGWSHGDDEIFTRRELIELFEIEGVGKAAAAFDMEKFAWVNFQHMKRLGDHELASALEPYLRASGDGPCETGYLERVVALLRERCKTLAELAAAAHLFVSDAIVYDPKAVEKFLGTESLDLLDALVTGLEALAQWSESEIEACFKQLMEARGLKLGKLAQPVRVALTGTTVSPGIFELCAVLGRERTLARLRSACRDAKAGTLPLAQADAAG